MLSRQNLSPVIWNGDAIVGGEPTWFREAASTGKISRSADGAGYCLFVASGAAFEVVHPGQALAINSDGTIMIATIDAAVESLRELTDGQYCRPDFCDVAA